MNNKDIQTKIDNYLLSQMSEVEIQAFEAEMASDSQLKETVELQRLLVNEIKQRAFISEIIIETEERMNKVKPENKTVPFTVSEASVELKPAAYKIPFRQIMLVAWSAAAIFAGVFFVNQAFVNNRMDSQFEFNYTVPEAGLMRGGEANPQETEFLNATKLIDKQPEQALNALLKLYNFPESYIYYEDVRWYLALTELKLYNKHEAIKYLNELMDSEYYGEKASKLLEEL